MDDLISRQAAIDIVRFECGEWKGLSKTIENMLNRLSSAQPYTDEEIQKIQDLEQAELDKAYELGRQSAQPEQSIAQERYEDLCEYFKDCYDQGRSILNDRKEFKSWLDRMKWHVMKCDKLGRELEKLKYAQPERKWIPCSERLPEVDESVLVTTEWNDISIAWRTGIDEWLIHEGNTNVTTDDITAWMLLPEPWKGEKL